MSDSAEPSPPAVDDQVTLQIGEREFTTSRSTLTQGSDYFATMLSERWEGGRKKKTYYVDADGDLFAHLLRFLRHGVFPIFYEPVKGHDQAMYLALLEEAKFFQVTRLINWLEKRNYCKAVTIRHSASVVEGIDDLCTAQSSEFDVNYYPVWTTAKVYACHRGIAVHRGDPRRCGRACLAVTGDADNVYEDEAVVKTMVVRKQVDVENRLDAD